MEQSPRPKAGTREWVVMFYSTLGLAKFLLGSAIMTSLKSTFNENEVITLTLKTRISWAWLRDGARPIQTDMALN